MHVDVVTFVTSKSRRLTLSRSQMASARKLGAGENWELGVYRFEFTPTKEGTFSDRYHSSTPVPPTTHGPSSDTSRHQEMMTDRPRHAGVLPCSVPKERRQTSKASSISEGAKSGPTVRPKRPNPFSTHISTAFGMTSLCCRLSNSSKIYALHVPWDARPPLSYLC